MANTYTLISSNVLASSAASVTFSAIPSTYTDLVLRVSARSDGSAAGRVVINADAGTNYSRTQLQGDGSATASVATSNSTSLVITYGSNSSTSTANTFNNLELYFPNYNSTSARPISSFNVTENNAASSAGNDDIVLTAGLYRGASAITSIKYEHASANFVSGSSFYLYGIKNS